jgi:hypothetical protein
LEGGNPLPNLLEPRFPLATHSLCEGDTGFPVVNLLAAEALIARHELGNAHVTTGTVDWFFVVVIRHVVYPFKVFALYVPIILILSAFYNPNHHLISED